MRSKYKNADGNYMWTTFYTANTTQNN